MNVLEVLKQDLASDLRMNRTAYGGYTPAVECLVARVFGREEERMKAILSAISNPTSWWCEIAHDRPGQTFQVGYRHACVSSLYLQNLRSYQAALENVGFKTELVEGHNAVHTALFVTLSDSLRIETLAVAPQYLEALAQAKKAEHVRRDVMKIGTHVRIRESCLNEDDVEIIYAPHQGLTGLIEAVDPARDGLGTFKQATYRVAFDVPRPCSGGGFEANTGFMPRACFEILEETS